MAIYMTREEYQKKYGIPPVIQQPSKVDTKPAPLRMTRAEYDALYGPKKTPERPDTLGTQLLDRGSDIVDAVKNVASEPAPRTKMRVAGAIAGGINDTINAVVSPIISKGVDLISNIPAIQKLASSVRVSKGLDTVNAGVDAVQGTWKKFEEKYPKLGQDARDVTNVASLIPTSKGVVGTARVVDNAFPSVKTKVKTALEDRTASKIEKELFDVENNYTKTRTANEYSKDAGSASRRRIAETDVLAGAIDNEGIIRTKLPGGAVEKYKKQTVDGVEGVVRDNLIQEGAKVSLRDIQRELTANVGSSGLEGADLVAALNGVKKEIAGLKLRADADGMIDLSKLHDAKISTTNNINYQTPPETKTYRKAVARTYKEVVESKSKVNVREINAELSKYYEDIERLENLDGRRVKGGKLGKYFAQISGNMIGAAAGSVAGPAGMAVSAVIGGEAAGFIKGRSMAKGFGKDTGRTAPKNPILERARLNVPDKAVEAPKGTPKTKAVVSIEKEIKKNVEAQKAAIKKGDFTLVATLKEVYASLVEKLKDAIKFVKENAGDQRGMVNFGASRKGQSNNLGSRKTQYRKSATTSKIDMSSNSNIKDMDVRTLLNKTQPSPIQDRNLTKEARAVVERLGDTGDPAAIGILERWLKSDSLLTRTQAATLIDLLNKGI